MIALTDGWMFVGYMALVFIGWLGLSTMAGVAIGKFLKRCQPYDWEDEDGFPR